MKVLYTIIIICAQAFCYQTRAQSSVSGKEEARAFVQQFYDWYTILYNKETIGKNDAVSSDIVALNKRSEFFDAPLKKAIIDDANAQAKVAGEIVGFDADPFLNAQDDGFKYLAGNVKQVDDVFFVDIHGGLTGKTKKAILATEVVIIAEVINVKGKWIFKNFIYPGKVQTNLLDILKDMHKERIKEGYEKSK
jgi:hypothetical protein